jgi:hypothetical protein
LPSDKIPVAIPNRPAKDRLSSFLYAAPRRPKKLLTSSPRSATPLGRSRFWTNGIREYLSFLTGCVAEKPNLKLRKSADNLAVTLTVAPACPASQMAKECAFFAQCDGVPGHHSVFRSNPFPTQKPLQSRFSACKTAIPSASIHELVLPAKWVAKKTVAFVNQRLAIR